MKSLLWRPCDDVSVFRRVVGAGSKALHRPMIILPVKHKVHQKGLVVWTLGAIVNTFCGLLLRFQDLPTIIGCTALQLKVSSVVVSLRIQAITRAPQRAPVDQLFRILETLRTQYLGTWGLG